MSKGKYNPKDSFYRKAKKEQFAARSVYKLEEIDARFSLFKKNQTIVDLGSAPGSWLQYLASAVGEKGLVLGYDIVDVRVNAGPQVHAFIADVFDLRPERVRRDAWQVRHGPAAQPPEDWNLRLDAVVSDMMPKTSGIRDSDQAKSIACVEHAFALAQSMLGPEGIFVAKIFHGRGFDELLRDVRKVFKDVRVLKPKATREGSRESFIVGRGLKPTAASEPSTSS